MVRRAAVRGEGYGKGRECYVTVGGVGREGYTQPPTVEMWPSNRHTPSRATHERNHQPCISHMISCPCVTSAWCAVPQYFGNGIWDGRFLSVRSAAAAMLRDPFAFTMSPETEALSRLFGGQSPRQLSDGMRRAWRADARFPADDVSTLRPRIDFFDSLQRLTPAHVATHLRALSAAAHTPPTVSQRLLEALAASRRSYQPPAGTWQHLPNLNCYGGGHGAMDITDGGVDFLPVDSVESCVWECLQVPACEGFVINLYTTSEYEQGNVRIDANGKFWYLGHSGQCYLRSAIAPARCDASAYFDTYVLTRSAPPGAADGQRPTPPGAATVDHNGAAVADGAADGAAGESSTLGHEAAVCAAVHLADAKFAAKSAFDIWVSDVDASRTAEANRSTLFASLYHPLTYYEEDPLFDPHSDVYTTVYQTHALGFYGGNATFVYTPASAPGSSGFDIDWAQRQMCPGPPPQGVSLTEWKQTWCWKRRHEAFLQEAAANPDAGELRTPNYKGPHEVDGVMLHARAGYPPTWSAKISVGFDLSSLVRPIQWALFRARRAQDDDRPGDHGQAEDSEENDAAVGATAGESAVIVVLAPSVASQPIYGVHQVCCPQRFVAAHSPPSVIKPMFNPPAVARGVPFYIPDIATPTGRPVPVWGVLHRCASSRSAAASSPLNSASVSVAAVRASGRERERVCNAAAVLRPLIQSMDTATRAAVMHAALPAELEDALAGLRVWPSDAYVDLSVSPLVRSPSRGESRNSASQEAKDSVCALSVATLTAIDAELGGESEWDCPPP